jgi:hypothetical protein
MKRILSIALTVVLLTTVLGGTAAMPVAAEVTADEEEGDNTNLDVITGDILSDNIDDLLSGNDVVLSDLFSLDNGDDAEGNEEYEESSSLLGLA